MNTKQPAERPPKRKKAPGTPPTHYRVKITVTADKDPLAPELTLTLNEIAREDILAPDYPVPAIAKLTKRLEYYAYGVGEPPDED